MQKENLTDQKLKAEFKEIMLLLKLERQTKYPIKIKELARLLSITDNYINAVENGNVFPSMKLFLKYLLLCEFDLSNMKSLYITRKEADDRADILNMKRYELIRKMLKFSEGQLDFLTEQTDIRSFQKLKSHRSK